MRISKKLALMVMGIGTLALSFSGVALAHVAVKPSDAKTGAYQTFVVGVPTEKDSPTISVKLDIPMGVTSVTPTAKPGWTIQTEKHGEGDEAMISTITWTGGKVDVGYRDEFTFSAKTPDQPTDLQWKAYQTYQDGTVVSWDQAESAAIDEENATSGPFSVTKVATDSDQDKALKAADSKANSAQQAADRAFYTGLGGIILAGIAITILIIRKPKV